MVSSSPVYQTFNIRNNEYSINRNEFQQKYENLCNDRFVSLNKEFKKLIDESMVMKKKQCCLYNTMISLSDLYFDGPTYIMQVKDVKITISRSSYSNEKLDSVFIPHGTCPKCIQYIVSIDPSIDNVMDFLHMIWEHNVSYVVTLTRLCKEKFQGIPFWPTSEDKVYFTDKNIHSKYSYKVSKTKEVQIKNLIKRDLIIQQKGCESRVLTQFHLTTAFNKNNSPYELYEGLLQELHKITTPELYQIKPDIKNRPILFHSSNSNLEQCSMLISINKIISNLADDLQEINIYETVLQINQFRKLMIQNEHQYFDIYEYISCYLKEREIMDLDITLVPGSFMAKIDT